MGVERATEIPAGYRWLVGHRRLAAAIASGSAGLLSLGFGWWGVTNTVVVADQLSYIASGGLLGLFLLGVAAIAYWGEQRERELAHIHEVQLYLSAIATALGLTEEAEQRDETLPGPAGTLRASNGRMARSDPDTPEGWVALEVSPPRMQGARTRARRPGAGAAPASPSPRPKPR